jgi:hypothetical protein
MDIHAFGHELMMRIPPRERPEDWQRAELRAARREQRAKTRAARRRDGG